MLTCEARVQTRRPSRYLAQLCQHFSNKGRHLRHRPGGHGTGDTQTLQAGQAHVEWSQTSGTVSFPAGQCTLQTGPGELILRAEAGDEETLRQIQDLVTSHLSRFSRRDPLTVTWQRAETLTVQPGEPD